MDSELDYNRNSLLILWCWKCNHIYTLELCYSFFGSFSFLWDICFLGIGCDKQRRHMFKEPQIIHRVLLNYMQPKEGIPEVVFEPLATLRMFA